ncbi:MAG: hypothetical protein NZ869_07355 [Thermoanaerobaculum sp.]|nr:hypothetical protein [Thermoanaerobaculum sp.]
MGTKHEVPLFCEELPLKWPVRWAAMVAVASLLLTGVAVGALRSEAWQWVSGLCLTLGSAGAVGLWRCSRFETSISRFGVRAGCWELAWTFPRTEVTAAQARKARSWRVWFASQEVEVVLSVTAGARRLSLPTREPEELLQALRAER